MVELSKRTLWIFGAAIGVVLTLLVASVALLAVILSNTKPVTPGSEPAPGPSVKVRRNVAVLVDASKAVDQALLKKETAFIEKELISELSSHDRNSLTSILILPYAFDMSPDSEALVAIKDKKQIESQLVATKISKITTFVEPLDSLQIGVALTELVDLQLKLTHIVILASGKGTDFESAKKMVPSFAKNKTQLITVSLNKDASVLQGLASDSECMLAADSFQNKELAKKIGTCIYSYVSPTMKSDASHIIHKRSVVSEEPLQKPLNEKVVKNQARKPADPPYKDTNNAVILVDATMDVEKVAEYIKEDLIKELKKKYTKYVCIAPFAYYLSADVTDGYVSIDKPDLIKQQLEALIISKITTFGKPLDKRYIIPTLYLLQNSSGLVTRSAHYVMFTSGADEPPEKKSDWKKVVIDSLKNQLVVVYKSLQGKEFDRKQFEEITTAFFDFDNKQTKEIVNAMYRNQRL